MYIHEIDLNEIIISKLIKLSETWAAENSCYGYHPNNKSDIEGNRIFVAEDNGDIVGYLLGKVFKSEKMKSIMPEGTPYFEVEEIYVIPEKRSQGIGEKLFICAEEKVKNEAEYIMLNTATKNWKAILHFYIDELDMTFWSARLFKKLDK